MLYEKAEGINRMIFLSKLKFKWLVSIVLKLLMFSSEINEIVLHPLIF